MEQLGYRVVDMGNIPVPNREEHSAKTSTKRLQAVTDVCQAVFDYGRECVEAGDIAIFLGGDHSISIGSVTAMAHEDGPIGVVWIDAHGDYNTPSTSPSGNIHGMPVAVLVGDGPEPLVNLGKPGSAVQPHQVVQIGIRDLDMPERKRVLQSGIHVYTMRHVDEMGMAAVVRNALDKLRHYKRIHVSLDLDVLDPSEAPGVGTPVPGGLTYREAHLLMEILGDSGLVRSLDVVEVNPILDRGNHTAEVAVGLAASLFGQRIL
jgi:arginase